LTDTEFNKLLSTPEKLSGGYLFFGEEDFVKFRYADRFQSAVVGEDTFSATAIEGPELTPSLLAQSLGSVSMFGGRRFVRVDHAPAGSWNKKKEKRRG
jgi:DNA polymerase III delta subunit